MKRMMATGHRVEFDGEGRYVENKYSGEITWLREEHGNFVLDLWIMPREQFDEMKRQGFGRQR